MKRLLSIFLVTALLLSSSSALVFADNISQIIGDGNTVIFIDVPANYWARNEIESFYRQDLVSGVGNDKFAPEDGVTREQFARMLVTTFHVPMATPGEPTFSDLPANSWSYPYVETVKDYLTAYSNPFGGKPTFRGEDFATREDITVALVRMMGFTESDITDKSYASKVFSDAAAISPSLQGYVSLAVQKGLISGYPDGTFGPTRGITRAEAVVLLSRATKQAVNTIEADVMVSATVVTGADPKNVTIMITTEEGAKITVDGASVTTRSNGAGQYEGAHTYTFPEEGSKTFMITATKAGKSANKEITATYQLGAPTIQIIECPAVASQKSVTISGTFASNDSSGYAPTITVNGAAAYTSANQGTWSYQMDLKEGVNPVEIVVTNRQGKITRESRSIMLDLGAPSLTLTYCPETHDAKSVTIQGTVKDTNDRSPKVLVNGKSAWVSYDGTWTYSLDLKEGVNAVEITASNNLGKVTTERRSITFDVGGPDLRITSCPESSSERRITIQGVLKDANDNSPKLLLNGSSVYTSYDGSFTTTYDLSEGDNTLQFTATNTLGKTTQVTKNVRFSVSGPDLRITYCPSSTNENRITIRGTVNDANDRSPSVLVNGQSAWVSYDGTWTMSVTLNEGDNEFEFQATNNLGKSTTETKTVTYTPN